MLSAAAEKPGDVTDESEAMDQAGFDDYLKNRYEDQVDWYDGKAGDNQRIYRRMQWCAIVLAAATPVLIELDLGPAPGWFLGHLAALTGVIVAILTAGLKTFKYQENWINYRTTCETLKKEKHYYDARVGEYRDAADREALFVERVEDLISRENTMWVSRHRPETRPQQGEPTHPDA